MSQFTIKEPCIVDGSHWQVMEWNNLDPRIVAVIWKATQGKYYVDPTCPDFWYNVGLKGLPRSAYHFFDINDVAAQVTNFLTYCEDVGIIASGKWMAEIEPILDAEYAPATAAGLMYQRLSEGRRKDLENPELYLARNPRAISRRTNISMNLTASQLAGQYKAWLDGIESELGVQPIIYTSKWFWDYTGNPAWAKDYKLFDAQYPFDPDGQSHGKYLPYGGWTSEKIWQYAEGPIAGVTTEIDLDVYNGTKAEFEAEYGGVIIPPTGEDMITIMTVKAATLNVRSTPDLNSTTNIIGPQFLKQGDMLWGVEKTDTCVRFTKVRRSGVELTLPGPVCWCTLGTSYMWHGWDMESAGEGANLEYRVRGSIVYSESVPAGSNITVELTD